MKKSSDSYLSLIRWKRHSFVEGEVYLLAGILKDCANDKLTLENQGLKVQLHFNENCFFEDHKGQKRSVKKKSVKKSFLNGWVKKGDHILLYIEFSKGDHKILKIKKILSSSECLFKWNEKISRSWSYFLTEIKNFFLAKGLCPVETPTLVSCPGTEVHLQFFSTVKKMDHDQKKMWLSSSPEMHLKKLLCLGATDIFEIHKSYRNNESGPRHLNEFYLLEWYRAYARPALLVQDLENLLQYLKRKKIILFSVKNFQWVSVKELFKKYCEMDLTPQSKDLIPALKKWNIPFNEDYGFEDLFYLLFLNRIEPNLNPDIPTIVYNYPPSLRAYSQLTEDGWADRFEFYWKGLELANAFYEINDAEEQDEIFKEDLKKRKDLKPDLDLIAKMKMGMPPCSGIALGLERLFMAVYGYEDISKIHPF